MRFDSSLRLNMFETSGDEIPFDQFVTSSFMVDQFTAIRYDTDDKTSIVHFNYRKEKKEVCMIDRFSPQVKITSLVSVENND